MNLSFPSSLSPANLEKQMRAALGNNPPPTLKPKEISEAFKQLETVHKGVDTSLFQAAKLATAEAVEVRLQQIESDVMSAAKAAAEQARKVATIGKKVQSEFGKDKAAVKAVSVVSDAAVAASAYATDLMKAAQAAQVELKALLAKLQAEDKKSQQAADKAKKDDKADKEGGDDAEDLANDKDEKKFREKAKAAVKSGLQRVRKPENPPAKFTIAYVGKSWAAYLGKSSGETEKKICARLLGQTGSVKYAKGLVTYIPKEKVWVFEGATVPPGAGNARNLQIGLHALIGFKPKVRLQRPGEKGEDAEGEADPDEKDDDAQSVAQAPGADARKVKALQDRMAELKPRLDKVGARNAAQASLIKKILEQFNASLLALQFGAADKILERVTALAESEEQAKGGAAAPGGLSLVKLAKARLDWAGVRSEAVRGIERLAAHIEQEYRNEPEQRAQVKLATDKLRALGPKLKVELENQLDAALNENDAARRQALIRSAKGTLTDVLKLVVQDPLMKELDGNELMPDLQVVKPMQEQLRAIAAALG